MNKYSHVVTKVFEMKDKLVVVRKFEDSAGFGVSISIAPLRKNGENEQHLFYYDDPIRRDNVFKRLSKNKVHDLIRSMEL